MNKKLNKKFIQKRIRLLFFLLLGASSSLVFSTKVNAFEITTQVDTTGNSWQPTSYLCTNRYEWGTPHTYTDNSQCYITNSSSYNSDIIQNYTQYGQLHLLSTNAYIPIEKGNYYSFNVYVGYSRTYSVNIGGVSTPISNQRSFLWQPTSSVKEILQLVSTRQVSSDEILSDGSNGLPYRNVYEVTLKANTSGSYRISIGNNDVPLLLVPNCNGICVGVAYANMGPITEYKPILNDDIAEAEQKTEEATNEGESNAQSTESQNETATDNVISVMGRVVDALRTPSSNCTLDMDLGNVDFGAINLCSGKPPAIASLINLVGSIVVVYAIYLCSRSIFRIWLAMSVFAQGGSKNG